MELRWETIFRRDPPRRGSLSRNILYSISARSNIKKSRESEPASANNLLSRRVRHPEKQNPPSSRRRQRWRKEKREARLFRRGKNSATWSPFRRPLREYLAYMYAYARVYECVCACTRSRRIHSCPRVVGCKLVLKNLEVN